MKDAITLQKRTFMLGVIAASLLIVSGVFLVSALQTNDGVAWTCPTKAGTCKADTYVCEEDADIRNTRACEYQCNSVGTAWLDGEECSQNLCVGSRCYGSAVPGQNEMVSP